MNCCMIHKFASNAMKEVYINTISLYRWDQLHPHRIQHLHVAMVLRGETANIANPMHTYKMHRLSRCLKSKTHAEMSRNLHHIN